MIVNCVDEQLFCFQYEMPLCLKGNKQTKKKIKNKQKQ